MIGKHASKSLAGSVTMLPVVVLYVSVSTDVEIKPDVGLGTSLDESFSRKFFSDRF